MECLRKILTTSRKTWDRNPTTYISPLQTTGSPSTDSGGCGLYSQCRKNSPVEVTNVTWTPAHPTYRPGAGAAMDNDEVPA